MLGLGHEVFTADGATFVRNRELPDIWEANHLTAVTVAASADIERLLTRVEREYAGLAHRRFDLDFTTSPAFEARLLLDGYQAREFLVMALADDLRSRAPLADIRACASPADWVVVEARARSSSLPMPRTRPRTRTRAWGSAPWPC